MEDVEEVKRFLSSGYGYGMKEYNGRQVYNIDGLPTLIYSVAGNSARCAIVQKDMTLRQCYVAKAGDFFAHGETLREAMQAAQKKYRKNKPLDERIKDFMQCAPTLDSVCENEWLFSEHHILTGSCLIGRKLFVKEHEIDVENGSMTVASFIELTKGSYGGDVIERLLEAYKERQEGNA